MINTQTIFPFTTELPNEQHYMPIRQQGTERVKLFVVDVADGKGELSVSFSESGIYYIDEKDLVTTISINGAVDARFTLYVGE